MYTYLYWYYLYWNRSVVWDMLATILPPSWSLLWNSAHPNVHTASLLRTCAVREDMGVVGDMLATCLPPSWSLLWKWGFYWPFLEQSELFKASKTCFASWSKKCKHTLMLQYNFISYMEFKNHAWPLVSWPVLTGQKNSSTLHPTTYLQVYFYELNS